MLSPSGMSAVDQSLFISLTLHVIQPYHVHTLTKLTNYTHTHMHLSQLALTHHSIQ